MFFFVDSFGFQTSSLCLHPFDGNDLAVCTHRFVLICSKNSNNSAISAIFSFSCPVINEIFRILTLRTAHGSRYPEEPDSSAARSSAHMLFHPSDAVFR